MRSFKYSQLILPIGLAACVLAPTALVPANGAAKSKKVAAPQKRKGYGVAQVPSLGYGAPAGLKAALKKVVVPAPSLKTALARKPKIRLVTNKGTILLELDATAAPLTVRSFVYLTNRGFYNGTVFHRYADLLSNGGTIIQGGDPLTRDRKTRHLGGIGGPGYTIPLEISKLRHEKLAIAMARSAEPDSGGSQFYICQGPVSFLDGSYTVFGKVIAGEKAALGLRQGDVIKSAKLVK
jgi:cyclophilin family peptidyl-prolyl cis-trans isomerase